MNWMIGLTGLLLLNTVTGGIGQLVWHMLRRPLERAGFLSWCHRSLWVVALLYLLPVAFAGMVWQMELRLSWGGVLFLPTPDLVRICRMLAALWLLGLVVTGCSFVRDLRAMGRLRRGACACGEWVQEIFREACEELSIPKGRVCLRQSGSLATAAFSGILRPMVMIPRMNFSREQLRVMFLHELTHYRQKDFGLLLLVRTVCVVHFWNPCCWRLNRLAQQWSEYACDEAVCEKAGGLKAYYGTICDLFEAVCQAKGALAPHLGRSRNELMRRVAKRKTQGNRRKMPLPAAAFLLAALCLSTGVTAMAAEGLGRGYRKCYQATLAEVEPYQKGMPELTEYTDDGPACYLGVLSCEEQRKGSSHFLSCSALRKMTVQTEPFYVRAGARIPVYVYTRAEGSAAVKAGVAGPDGERVFICGNGILYHVFTVPAAGNYRIFVENQGFTPVKVEGIWRMQ